MGKNKILCVIEFVTLFLLDEATKPDWNKHLSLLLISWVQFDIIDINRQLDHTPD